MCTWQCTNEHPCSAQTVLYRKAVPKCRDMQYRTFIDTVHNILTKQCTIFNKKTQVRTKKKLTALVQHGPSQSRTRTAPTEIHRRVRSEPRCMGARKTRAHRSAGGRAASAVCKCPINIKRRSKGVPRQGL